MRPATTFFLPMLEMLLGATLLLLPGCIATAPVSIAWRSNSNLLYATTDGKTEVSEESPAVNADRTTNADTKVARSITGGQ